jgi:hypothetical protein
VADEDGDLADLGKCAFTNAAALTRIAEGGRVIAPGDPARSLQLIDVRDVSTFVLDQVEAQAGGIHNVVRTRRTPRWAS